jgi:hypothetical protein
VTASQPAEPTPGNGAAATIIRKFLGRVLPSTEAIPAELALWHPELDPSSYISSGTYPRCWIYQAGLLLALDHPGYAAAIIKLAQTEWPDSLERIDLQLPRLAPLFEDSASVEAGFNGILMRDGTLVNTRLVEGLSDWRRVLDVLMSIDRAPKSMPHAFVLGLLVALRYSTAAKVLVSWMHTDDSEKFRTLVENLRASIDANSLPGLEGSLGGQGLSELLPLED